MRARQLNPFHSASDLLKMYRQAERQTRYMSDLDAKLVAYNNVIRSCVHSKFCRLDESRTRNQILFWTYNKIGDTFLESAHTPLKDEDYVFALQYYQNALELTRQTKERRSVLEKIAAIYQTLNDQQGARRAFEQIAEEIEEPLKRQTYAVLARRTDDPFLEASYLEQALQYVPDEKASAQAKCQTTLRLCRRLIELYSYLNDHAGIERITTLQKKTLALLND